MVDIGEALACRLMERDEQLRRQQELVEEQRRWLLSNLMAFSGGDDCAGDEEEQENEPRQPRRRLRRAPSSHGSRCAGVPVEDRLLMCGRLAKDRAERARQIRLQEREAAEEELLAGAAPNRRSARSVAHPDAEQLARKRALRQQRLVEESLAGLSFQPRISAESARLAHERRVKDRIENMSVADSLLYRKAMSDGRIERKRVELNSGRAVPKITQRAKELTLPFTASERLYIHAKERKNEERELEERLREVIEENVDLTFRPFISGKARQLQRKPGRQVHEDLYEHGVQKQKQQQQLVTSEKEHDFRPSINRVSELIATRMKATTAERLMRPRQTKNVETPSFNKQLRDEVLDLRFDKLYKDACAQAVRRQSLMQEEKDLDPECTFAPKINRRRVFSNGAGVIPVDVRTQLWQERKNHKLEAARREAEKKDEAATLTPSRRRTLSMTGRSIDVSGPPRAMTTASNSGTSTSNLDLHINTGGASRMTQSADHCETIFRALQALENAERASRYIMVD